MADVLEDIYYPNWSPYFDTDGNLLPGKTVSINCQICHEKLAIMEPPGPGREALTILPCNHVFGADCLRRWLLQSTKCPSCRVDTALGCGHPPLVRELHGGSSFNIKRDMQPFLDEKADKRDACDLCKWLEGDDEPPPLIPAVDLPGYSLPEIEPSDYMSLDFNRLLNTIGRVAVGDEDEADSHGFDTSGNSEIIPESPSTAARNSINRALGYADAIVSSRNFNNNRASRDSETSGDGRASGSGRPLGNFSDVDDISYDWFYDIDGFAYVDFDDVSVNFDHFGEDLD